MADAQDLGSCTERCRGSTPLSCILAVALGITLGGQSSARGDTLWVGSGGGGGTIQVSNAKILRVEKDQIIFLTGGRETSRELSKVQRLNVDGEPALNQAEEALAAGKWDAAVEAYQTVLRATNKPWIKDWSSARLLEAASKSGRFDAAATAFISAISWSST